MCAFSQQLNSYKKKKKKKNNIDIEKREEFKLYKRIKTHLWIKDGHIKKAKKIINK